MGFKKIILFSSFLALFGFLFNFNVPTVKAATVEELLAKIQQLQTQILLIQGQLAVLQGPTEAWCHDFNTNIKWKDTGNEVEALQTILEKEGFQISADEKTNKYFYTSTLEAVMDFQLKYKVDISKSAGYEIDCTGFGGSGTRAQLNELYGCKVKPCITVLSPNGGESWAIGNTYTISWKHNFSQNKEYVGKITLLKGGSFYGDIASITSGVTGYPWKVGDIKGEVGTGNDYKIKIEFTNQSGKIIATDISDNYFSIVSTSTPCTDSDGGLNYYVKGVVKMTQGPVLELYDACADSNLLQERVCNSNTDYLQNTVNFTCPYGCQDGACLSTTQPSIAVLSPNGGETYIIGTGYLYIKYKVSNISIGTEVTAYLKNPAGNVERTSVKTVENDGINTLPMNMELAASEEPGQYKIEVCAKAKGGDVCDASDNYFSIVATSTLPDIQITDITPASVVQNRFTNYTATVKNNSSQNITTLFVVNLGGITTNISSLSAWQTATVNASFGLSILGPNQVCARVDIWNTVAESNESNNDFCKTVNVVAASTPSLTVISPNGGEKWVVGNTYTITWNASSDVGQKLINISLKDSRNDYYTYIAKDTTSIYLGSGKYSYSWTVPQSITPGENMFKVRVESMYLSVYDESDNYFSIVAATSSRQDVFLTNLTNYNNIVSWEVVQKPAAGSSPSGLTYYWIYKIKNISDYKIKLNYKAVNSITGENLTGLGGGAIVLIGNPDTYYSLGSTVSLDKGQTHELHFSLTLSSSVKPEDFALRITLESVEQATPSLTVISPNGGETWVIGKTYNTTWKASDLTKTSGTAEKVNIELTNGTIRWSVAYNVDASFGTYSWTIPSNQQVGNNYKIHIWDASNVLTEDYSDNNFSIVAATTVCTDSDGGLNYNVKGTVTSGGAANTDVCSNSGYLFEQYCLNGNPVQATYLCPNGCQDGACLATSTNILNIAKAATSPSGTVARGTFQTYAIWDLYNTGSNNINITSLTLKSKTGLPPTISATSTSMLFRLTDEYGTIITLGNPVVSYSAGTITFDSTVLIGGVFTIPANSLKTLKLQITTTNTMIWPAYTPMQWEINSVSATGGTVSGLPATTNQVTIMNGLGLIDIENQLANISKAISALLEQINKLLGM